MISDHTWPLSAVLNQYETAIKSVGDIIEDYDTDKLFPVLGFGKIEKSRISVSVDPRKKSLLWWSGS